MKKKRAMILGILAIIAVLVYLGVSRIKWSMAGMEKNLKQLVDLQIADIDLSKVPDGMYSGSYKVFPVSAEVNVTVENHRIARIDLVKHGNGQGAGAEVIPGKVVEAQSLQVDMVSGATYSSKVILKAIENALSKAKQTSDCLILFCKGAGSAPFLMSSGSFGVAGPLNGRGNATTSTNEKFALICYNF